MISKVVGIHRIESKPWFEREVNEWRRRLSVYVGVSGVVTELALYIGYVPENVRRLRGLAGKYAEGEKTAIRRNLEGCPLVDEVFGG